MLEVVVINFFKNGMMPSNQTSAIVSLASALTIVVLYTFFSNFFINVSIMIALLTPLFIAIYYLINLIDRSLEILMG